MLLQHTYPQLRQICASGGCELQLFDHSWICSSDLLRDNPHIAQQFLELLVQTLRDDPYTIVVVRNVI